MKSNNDETWTWPTVAALTVVCVFILAIVYILAN